jgi:prepilin-type N-terminal cleavage/methylation domain-containing protein
VTRTAWQKFLAGSAGRHSCAGRNPSPGDPLDSRLRGNDRRGVSSRITDEGLLPLCTRGFSLLELLVVLTILGIVGSLTVFQLRPLFSQVRFNAGVRKVVSDLQLVRMKAVAQNQRFRVTFRPDSHDYIIEKRRGRTWTRQVLHTYGTIAAPEAAIPLPKGMRITAVNSGGNVIFIPRGHIDAGMTLILSSLSEEYTRRIIFSLAGRVRIE